MYFRFYPLTELFAHFIASTYGLLHFRGSRLRFPLASDEVAKGDLLQRERPPFNERKAMFYTLKGHGLKP